MSNDRDKMTADRSVSATYRELADERTPPALDEAVLRRAAVLPSARSGIGRAWMKPVAWAATLGLSFAIVLEVTQVPQGPLDATMVPPTALTDERPVTAPAGIEPAAVKAGHIAKPSRHRSESGVIDESEAQAMPPRQANIKVQAEAPESVQSPVRESTDLQPLADADMSPDARGDEIAGAATFAVRAKQTMLEQPNLCPETVREVAEDWYQCIEAQRDEVSAARITRELEEFRKVFPDFQVSAIE